MAVKHPLTQKRGALKLVLLGSQVFQEELFGASTSAED